MSTIDDLVAQASGLQALSAAQIQAAQSALSFATAQAKLAAAEEEGNVAAREAAILSIKQLQLSEALRAAKSEEAAAAQKAADDAKAQQQQEKDAAKAATDRANTIRAAGETAASAIRGLGSAVVAIANGPIPNATQAMTAVGQAMGSVVMAGADRAAEALSKLGPAGQAAAAAIQAVGMVAAATVGTLMTIAGVAIDAVQKIDLLRDSFAGLAGGAAQGKALQDSIARLNLPFAADQVNAWAATLAGAGVKGKELEEQLKAIAAAQASGAVFGKNWGAATEEFFKKMGAGGPEANELLKKIQQGGMRGSEVLKNMGLDIGALGGQAAVAKMSAEQLTKAVEQALQKRGKGPLEDMALTLPAILTKAKEGFLSLFSGLGPSVKSFMKSVQGLFGEFNKGSPLIKGLKPIVTDVLSTVFSWLKKGVDAAHELIAGFMGARGAKGPFAEIGAAIRPVVDAAKGLFVAFQNLNKGKPDGLSSSMSALVVIVKGVAAGIGIMIDNATMALTILGSLGDIADAATGALSGLAGGAMEAASNFVAGLVDGISAGAGQVIAAVSGLASGALGAFKSMLGIASPSRVMMEMGGHTATGFAQGVDDGADKAQASMDAMVTPKVGKGGPAGAKSGPTFNFTNCTFGGDITPSKLRAMLTEVLYMVANEGPAKVTS